MRTSHRRACLAGVFSALSLAIALVTAPPVAAQEDSSPVRAKDAPLSEIRKSVVPEGGIKAAMTGGNTVFADVREERPRADGYRHIDTPALVGKLKAHGLNTYVYGIWDSPTDWDDLRLEFAPAAAAAGIKIWVYVVPPSECFDHPVPHRSGRCSRPYKLDFVSWAREIATLSTRYSNIVAWAIDDFIVGANGELFTPEYMQRIVDSQDAVNPRLGFYTTAYLWEATNPAFYERFAPYIDGIVFPYLGASINTQDPAFVAPQLDQILGQTEPRGLGVLFLAYANRFLDAALPPTETYVAKTIENAMPYARSGRILGVDAYGMPLGGKPAITADNRAAHGIGRFNVSLASFAGTRPGDFAGIEQRVVINPFAPRHILRFAEFDGYIGNLGGHGYHIKQVLVDGVPAWESDVADPGSLFTYQQREADLTAALRGKTMATLTLRILDRQGVGDFPLDVGFDDLHGDGFTVFNGGFEADFGWRTVTNNSSLLPSIDLYTVDRPARIRAAVAATANGLPFVNPPFLPERQASGYRSDNRAMYGDGRLSLTIPQGATTTANGCATASQRVPVDPASPRYEVSHWDYDQYAKTPSVSRHLFKRVLIDGFPVYDRDVDDWWENTWMNGDSAQGAIDVTEFVRGKPAVTLSYQLCAITPTAHLPIDVGVDTIQTVGLAVRNPDFESSRDWELTTTDPAIRPSIVIAR